MTTYIALSPKRRTEHQTWRAARAALVDDALELANAKKDPALRFLFRQVGDYLHRIAEGDSCVRRYDQWGNPITFRIVAQKQFS